VARILVVDDDATVRGVVARYLRAADFDVAEAEDGLTALALDEQAWADLVLLDLTLPGIDGLEVFRRLKLRRGTLPVIMVTARSEEPDRILGLEVGADDYVAKPFSPRELVLRVRSVLRRADIAAVADPGPRLRDGDLELDPSARRVWLAGRDLALTVREFDLLVHLVAHPGTTFSREELMAQVWGWEYGDLSTVTVHVRRVREKIERHPGSPVRLVTVWGVGYRWDPAS
jgi:DNA-binding response OmpR family regulator